MRGILPLFFGVVVGVRASVKSTQAVIQRARVFHENPVHLALLQSWGNGDVVKLPVLVVSMTFDFDQVTAITSFSVGCGCGGHRELSMLDWRDCDSRLFHRDFLNMKRNFARGLFTFHINPYFSLESEIFRFFDVRNKLQFVVNW